MTTRFQSINPASGEVVLSVPAATPEEQQQALDESEAAFAVWRRTSMQERASLLLRLAEALRAHSNEAAEQMALEMGKPLRDGRSEVDKCAWVCEYYAENGAAFLADESVATDGTESRIVLAPLGPVLAIMPWNFPFWQLFRFAAPALMAGNTVLLKHAPNVPGCAGLIERIVAEAGHGQRLVRNLYISEAEVAALIEAPAVRAVTLTGSTGAGRAVAAAAGRALKKTVLELGGSDPYVVLADADLEFAVERCAQSRLINAGQSCIAAKRFIVEEPIYDDFVAAFEAVLTRIRSGDPLATDTDIGPLARHDLRETLHAQVERSKRAGARVVCGGTLPAGPGWYYPPTLLGEVQPQMAAFREETFGPVAAVSQVRSEAEAIELANLSPYRLGAAIFTRDTEKGERLAREALETGACFVNDFVRSDPRLPFGGIRQSGFGRELGRYGLLEFVNVKTVVCAQRATGMEHNKLWPKRPTPLQV